MSEPIITVENLSKRYLIGHQTAKGDGLRHVIENVLRAPQQWLRERRARRQAATEEFWALKEVSFEIQRGEVVGIIGRNGAGKSTLLKIMSRITAPTSGRITLDGRVASLLEVGTGFHAELTGRENIFLNGAILGMSKAEIKRKFDEIVAFSEVEKFLDTPVKRYSSGMYVRLAFAVAAHLEPEILIVDEVLAVGDAGFQKKCLGKMRDISGKEGRTVLFVSHNMAAVKALCTRVLFLSDGSVRDDGRPERVVSSYLNEKIASAYVNHDTSHSQPSVAKIWFSDDRGNPRENFTRGEHIVVNADLHNPKSEALHLELAFFDSSGAKIWNFAHEAYGLPPITAAPRARINIRFTVPAICLEEIFVHVGLVVCSSPDRSYIHHITEGLRFCITPPGAGTYRPPGTIISCPVDFKVASYES